MTNGVSAGRRTIGVLVILAIGWAGFVLLKPRDLPSIPDMGTGSPDKASGQSEVPVMPDTEPTPETPDAPKVLADMTLPKMDVVRVDGLGATVVAGNAARDVDVILRLDGQEVATARTDADGNFVSLFDVPITDAPRILTVETRGADGVVARATDSIIVAPTFPTAPAQDDIPRTVTETVASEADVPRPPGSGALPPVDSDNLRVAAVPPPQIAPAPTRLDGGSTAEGGVIAEDVSVADATGTGAIVKDQTVSDEIGTDATAVIVPSQTSDAPEIGTTRIVTAGDVPTVAPQIDVAPAAPSSVSSITASDAPLPPVPSPPPARAATPPRLFRAGAGGVTVLPDNTSPPDVRQDLGIDAISYDAAGEVQLAGRGVGDTQIRIYLDNRPIQQARVDRAGTWTSPLPNVDSGTYTLRIDSLAADGTVTGRVETPFQRTAPAVAAASRRDGVTAITVQPGYTLWAISEGYFGEGIRYVQIFEENQDFIRDPDLIYPGQVFKLPDVE